MTKDEFKYSLNNLEKVFLNENALYKIGDTFSQSENNDCCSIVKSAILDIILVEIYYTLDMYNKRNDLVERFEISQTTLSNPSECGLVYVNKTLIK